MIKLLTLDQFDDWQAIISQFPQHDIHYDARYLQLFRLHDTGQPRLIYFDNGDMQAVSVVLQRDIAEFAAFKDQLNRRQYFDYTTVFGYGGFLYKGQVNSENLQALDQAYTDLCRKKRVVSEFVKGHPLLINHLKTLEDDPLYKWRTVGHPVAIQLQSAQQIWDDFSSSRRRVIRKAVKAGVKVNWSNDPKLLEDFIPLYQATMDRDQACEYFYFSQDFYEAVPSLLSHNMLFFYAHQEGEIMAIAMILFDNSTVQYFLSGSNPTFNHLSPTSLIIYEAALFAQSHGYQTFFLGGGQESLLKYKQGFNQHNDLDFQVGNKIFNQEVYDKLVQMRSEKDGFDSQSDFFPLYRA